LAKTFGFIACTVLAVASVWVANSSAPVKTIEAASGPGGQGQFQVGDGNGNQPYNAADYLELGKRYYRVGQTAEAIHALEEAQSAPGGLTMPQRVDLNRFLARARRDANDPVNVAPASNTPVAGGAYVIAKQMLDDARLHAIRGDIARATQLATRAKSFRVNWKANELSPDQFLRELQAGKNPTKIGAEFAATSPRTTNDNPFGPTPSGVLHYKIRTRTTPSFIRVARSMRFRRENRGLHNWCVKPVAT